MWGMRWASRTTRSTAWAALACTVLVAPTSLAQDAKARAAAKKLEKEGIAAADSGDCANAVKKLDKAAEALTLSHTVQLKAAKCAEKNGRLIDAAGRYETIAKTPTTNKAEQGAQEEARKASKALEERIPTVVVELQGVDALSKVTLTLDGEPFPRTKVGVRHPIDPGDHTLEGTLERAGEEPIQTRQPFFVNERESVPLPFRFVRAAPKSATPTAPDGASGGATPSEDYWAMMKHKRGTQRTIGWIVVGTGGAAIVAGGVTTGIALGVKGGLDDKCPEQRCPPDAHGDLDTYETLKTVTTLLFIGGAVGMGVGVALIATSPGERTLGSPAPRVTPYVGLGSAGVTGNF
jgi:hypothetical protein